MTKLLTVATVAVILLLSTAQVQAQTQVSRFLQAPRPNEVTVIAKTRHMELELFCVTSDDPDVPAATLIITIRQLSGALKSRRLSGGFAWTRQDNPREWSITLISDELLADLPQAVPEIAIGYSENEIIRMRNGVALMDKIPEAPCAFSFLGVIRG